MLIKDAEKNILKYALIGNDGIDWYKNAHEYCQNLGQLYNVKLPKVIGILAALSPQNKWDSNKLDVATLLDCYDLVGNDYSFIWDSTRVSTFNANKHKAITILLGDDDPLHTLRGNKTRSFYHNILRPDCTQHVTIDRHAVSVARGDYIKDGSNTYYVRTTKRYNEMVGYYKSVAKKINIIPCQLQAITWINLRNAHGVI